MNNIRRKAIKNKIRKRLNHSNFNMRIIVYRSNKNFYVQLIDTKKSHTVLNMSFNNLDKSSKLKPVEKAYKLGELFGKKAQEMKFDKVVFDRNGFLYHGQVKSFAEGARKQGLKF